MLYLTKQFLGKKRSVKLCCHDTTAISFAANVWSEVFTYFHAVTVKVT
jgi:hypothetical protein